MTRNGLNLAKNDNFQSRNPNYFQIPGLGFEMNPGILGLVFGIASPSHHFRYDILYFQIWNDHKIGIAFKKSY